MITKERSNGRSHCKYKSLEAQKFSMAAEEEAQEMAKIGFFLLMVEMTSFLFPDATTKRLPLLTKLGSSRTGWRPRNLSINQKLEVGGKRNSHCFYISILFRMAFLPSLLDFLGLEKLPFYSLLRTYYFFSINSALRSVQTSPFSYLILGAAIKGTKYFLWTLSCSCALAQHTHPLGKIYYKIKVLTVVWH